MPGAPFPAHNAYMTRIVGIKDRTEFVLDAVQAWLRGRDLDLMLAAAKPAPVRGVIRATHAELNRIDDMRALAAARRLNAR